MNADLRVKRAYAPALVLFVFLIAGGLLVACGGGSGSNPPATDDGGNSMAASFPGSGTGGQSFITVDSVHIDNDRHFVVEFTLEDNGVPLSVDDLARSRVRWCFGWVDVDDFSGRTRYQSYIVRTVNGRTWPQGGSNPPVLPSAEQAHYEDTSAQGTLEDLGGGSYRYTSEIVLPAGFNADARHTLAGFAEVSDTEEVSNPIAHFVPSGGALPDGREIVVTANCNECHFQLGFHGGVRREAVLCQVCHTDQTVDPETGESVEFEHMIHKIHHGADLSGPYTIVGFGQRPHDYTRVHFPQDVRNCTKCHKNGDQSENWRMAPTRSVCGSCHDNIDWTESDSNSPAYHSGGPVTSDNGCASCHQADQVAEFDQTVPGSHVIPYLSSANPNLTLTITDVRNFKAGMTPEVDFMISDDSGPVDITTLQLVSIVFAGPTSDYTSLISTTNRYSIRGFGPPDGVLVGMGGTYTWTSPDVLGADVDATWAVGMEARTNSFSVDGNNINFGANNPVAYVDTTTATGNLNDPGASPAMRRQIVDEAGTCGSCHADIVFHGNLRTNLEYCVMCHNKWATDEGRRGSGSDPDGPLDAVTNPPESISFAYMIHKIHRGQNLTNGYSVWGFGPTLHDFTEVHYPGQLDQCAQCHLGGTQNLPVSSDAQALTFNIAGDVLGGVALPMTSVDFPIRPPTVAACTSCHDSDAALAHAMLNVFPGPVTDPFSWVESCSVCHGPGAAFEPHK